MPSLGDIAGMVAGASSRHIAVEAPRCVRVRHRRARCSLCIDICPESALSIERNEVTLRADRCTGCGACANVCPTQALRTVQPSAGDLLAHVDGLAAAAGTADGLELACRHAARSGMPARIVVPSLPYADEALLVHAALRGFDRIMLTCCNRDGCAGPALAALPDAIACARELLDVWGVSCDIRMRREKADVPSPHAPGDDAGREYSRRGLFSNVVAQTAGIVAETAADELRAQLGAREGAPTLAQSLTDGSGNLRKFAVPRAESLLNDLFELDPAPRGRLSARGFARVEVDGRACTRCALCARFCPTGALEGEGAPVGRAFPGILAGGAGPADGGGRGSLAFRAGDCVGCRLCEDVCPLRCLKVHDDVDASSIFELEPIDLL